VEPKLGLTHLEYGRCLLDLRAVAPEAAAQLRECILSSLSCPNPETTRKDQQNRTEINSPSNRGFGSE